MITATPTRQTAELPDVDDLIARAQAMRSWLLTATDCSCASLDACALFTLDADGATATDGAESLRITHVGGTLQRA